MKLSSLPAQKLVNSSFLYPHTGAILCGGKSTRMGRPKAGISLPSGLTMIEHVYYALASVCRQVVLVGHGEGVPPSLYHLRRIEDRLKNKGPISGLEALLSSGMDSEYLIAPCDLFRVTPEIFFLLINPKIKLPVILTNKGCIEPLLGRYPSSLLPLVRDHIAQEKLAISDLLEKVSVTSIAVPKEHLSLLSNMNSPGDLIGIKKLKIDSCSIN